MSLDTTPTPAPENDLEGTRREAQSALSAARESREKEVQNMGINTFLRKSLNEKLTALTNPPCLPESLTEDMTLRFDFYNNTPLERQISLADVMPPEVREVMTTQKNEELKGTRRGNTGEFYNAETGERLKIFTGTEVQICKIDETQVVQITEEQIATYLSSPAEQNAEQIEEQKNIIQLALEKGIDPQFILALQQVENGRAQRAFGVMLEGIDDPELQLIMAIKIIGRYEGQFARAYPNIPIRDNDEKYTPQALAYFSGRYAPVSVENDPENLNKNHLPNLANIYGQTDGSYTANAQEFLAQYNERFRSFNEPLKQVTADEVLQAAHRYEGRSYEWGGEGRSQGGIDCSGLVIQALRDTGAISPNCDAGAAYIFDIAQKIPPMEGEEGNMLFWDTPGKGITHVAIIEKNLGNGNYLVFDSSRTTGRVTTRVVQADNIHKVGILPHIA